MPSMLQKTKKSVNLAFLKAIQAIATLGVKQEYLLGTNFHMVLY